MKRLHDGIRRPYGSKNAAAGVGTHPPFAPFHVASAPFARPPPKLGTERAEAPVNLLHYCELCRFQIPWPGTLELLPCQGPIKEAPWIRSSWAW